MEQNPSIQRTILSYSVDASMRKLKIPKDNELYIEKFRISDIFEDITKKIVSTKPKDVLEFLKNQLGRYNYEFIPKVILIGPPQLDTLSIAKYVSNQMNCTPIRLQDVHTRKLFELNEKSFKTLQLEKIFTNLTESPFDIDKYESFKPDSYSNQLKNESKVDDFILILKKIIDEELMNKRGWILVDFPRNQIEAQILTKHNIEPTHVISLLPISHLELRNLCEDHQSDSQYENRLTMLELNKVYSHSFNQIHVCSNDIAQVGEMVIKSIYNQKTFTYDHALVNLRVLILGHEENDLLYLGNKLAEHLRLVHIDGRQYSTIKKEAILHRLHKNDCLQQGYVLTGYPNHLDELKNLDQCDASPNRILFLKLNEKHMQLSEEQKYSREHTMCSVLRNRSVNQSQVHDDRHVGANKKEMYNMLKYCGMRALIIEATSNFDTLFARVLEAIANFKLQFHSTNYETFSGTIKGDSTFNIFYRDMETKSQFIIPFNCTNVNKLE